MGENLLDNEELNESIDKLRVALHELLNNSNDEIADNEKLLELSGKLNQLINEYMSCKKNTEK